MSALPESTDESTDTFGTLDINGLRERHDWLVKRDREHKARVKTVTNVVIGNWFTEWPDLSQTPEAPAVANLIELGVNHWMSVGGAMLPSVKVPRNKDADQRTEKAHSRKRERRVRELWEASNASEMSALLWGDYAGAGSAVIGAWCNFEETDASKRNPYMMRFDPRHTYVVKDHLGNVKELHVARTLSKAELKITYPTYAGKFGAADEERIEEWFWYTPKRMIHMVVDTSKEGAKSGREVFLVDEDWALGFVPAWEITRATFDGERRGVFDQTVHILRTMQRLMLLTIMSTEESVYAPIGVYNVVNPKDFGPGATLQYRSADARVDRLGNDSHFDAKDLIARLASEAEKQSVFPQQLSGDPGASIVSARGINASMGALDARLALAHKQFEIGFGKVSGFLLAFDETYCPGAKTIVGDSRDTSASETYNPETDVAGAWVVTATYGIGAGSDPANVEVRLSMHLANGLISKKEARENLSFLFDPDSQEIEILREHFQDALVAGILSKAEQGDPSAAAQALKLMTKDTTEIEEVISGLIEFLQQPPPGAGGASGGAAGGALGAIQGAESMARGGVPGQAPQAPSPAGLGLPPLGGILNQDSRQVS